MWIGEWFCRRHSGPPTLGCDPMVSRSFWPLWLFWFAVVIAMAVYDVRCWQGKTTSTYLELNEPLGTDAGLSRGLESAIPCITAALASGLVMGIARYGVVSFANHLAKDFGYGLFYLGCVGLALSTIASLAIIMFRQPQALIPPQYRNK